MQSAPEILKNANGAFWTLKFKKIMDNSSDSVSPLQS